MTHRVCRCKTEKREERKKERKKERKRDKEKERKRERKKEKERCYDHILGNRCPRRGGYEAPSSRGIEERKAI